MPRQWVFLRTLSTWGSGTIDHIDGAFLVKARRAWATGTIA